MRDFRLSRSTTFVIASSSLAVATWRIILWRARTRAKKTVDRVRDLLPHDGPLVSCLSDVWTCDYLTYSPHQ